MWNSFPPPALLRACPLRGHGIPGTASRTPLTEGARTPHRGSPRLSSGARSPPSWGSARLLAAAGAGGGGDDDDGSGGSGGSRPDRGRGRGRGRGRRRQRSPTLPWTPPDPSQLPTPRGSWSPGRAPRTLGKRIYNDVYV